MSWGAAGMAAWGATCGIALSCAQVAELAMPRATTNGIIDQIFAHYCEDPHPFVDLGNNPDFLTNASRTPKNTNAVVKGATLGSLQCHNVVQLWRTSDYYKSFVGGSADVARGEFCGRLVGDLCYRTLKLINAARNNVTAVVSPSNGISTVKDGCAAANCHDKDFWCPTNLTSYGFMPNENCLVCHK